MAHHQFKQRRQILARPVQIGISPARTPRSVEMREIELFVIGAQIGEQVETFVQRPVGFRIGLVDLVQYYDGAQAQGQRLGGHEFGLGHRTLGGIDQQHDAIDHAQDALDLAAEIGVAGGVDDIDTGAAPLDRGRLGQDGDPPLAFQIVAVHGTFGDGLVFTKGAGLFQQFIHQRRLAVVHVSDDRNVAQVHEVRLFKGVGPAHSPRSGQRPEEMHLLCRYTPRRGVSRGQWGEAPENRWITRMPARIIAMPRMAGRSSRWPKTTRPMKAMNTIPRPDQIA